jgi:Glycosyltransferase
LLDVLALLPAQYTLTLVGFGTELARLQARALIFGDRVRFVIKPSHAEIARYYCEADIFVFASQTETQGLVLAEAMAAGLPVVALRGPGVVDIVREPSADVTDFLGNGFIVDSQEQMAHVLERIAQAPELYARLRSGAWKTSHAYWPENAINPLLAVYAQSARI